MPGDVGAHPSPGPLQRELSTVQHEYTAARHPPRHRGGVRALRDELGPDLWVHRRDLVDRGWSATSIRRAVAREDLIVHRRQWVLSPAAHPALHAAAIHGARVTCVTRAEHLGLWLTYPPDCIHLAVSAHSSANGEHRWHRSAPLSPAGRTLVDTLENTLAALARCLPHEQARATWESAIRRNLCSREHLARVLWRTDAARRLARECSELSDSGLETVGVSRLARAGIPVAQQVRLLGRAVDGLIGRRLVLQFDGWEFHRDPAQRRADIAHDRALHLAGYTVLRFDYRDVMEGWPRVEQTIRQAIAQGLHL